MDTLEGGWRRLVSEIGIRFDLPQAQQRLRDAGQDVSDDGVVRFDPDFLLEQVAKAPGEFAVHARNPARDIVFGGDHMVFGGVAGAPFVLDGAERRDGTIADLERFIQLGHTFDEIDTTGLIPCEPTDLPHDSRHLDMAYAQLTLTDKVGMAALFSGEKTRDSLEMTAIVYGGHEALRRAPAVYGVANVNSPLRYDVAMLEVMEALAEAGQVTVVTPFLLMGAMSPVSIPAALVQQTAEQLAGVAYVQLVRPGAPVLLGLVPLAHRHAVGLARASAGPSLPSACWPRDSWRGASACRGGRAAARSRPASGPMRRRCSRASTRCCRRSSPAPTSCSTPPAGWSRGWSRATPSTCSTSRR